MVAERDYVLAHVVSQLHHSSLGEGKRLVLKGGTAMRFVHFEDFRYSADLDFSLVGDNFEDGIISLAPVVEAAWLREVPEEVDRGDVRPPRRPATLRRPRAHRATTSAQSRTGQLTPVFYEKGLAILR